MVAVIIGREFAVTALRSLAYARGVAMPASPLGKIKMVAQVVAILAADPRLGALCRRWLLLGQAALWVVVATALVSAADYFRRFKRALGARVAVTDFAAAKARLEERRKSAEATPEAASGQRCPLPALSAPRIATQSPERRLSLTAGRGHRGDLGRDRHGHPFAELHQRHAAPPRSR